MFSQSVSPKSMCHLPVFLRGIPLLLIMLFFSCASSNRSNSQEQLYLRQLRQDFVAHKEDVLNIGGIATRIVGRIDSLLNGKARDTANGDLIRRIMTTRAFNTTIMAYRDILNGAYISSPEIRLAVARHVARFAGIAESKRGWDNQWDVTSRPFMYNHALLKPGTVQYNLISDPVIRSMLFDRRMFAHDTEIYTPVLAASADSVIALIDTGLKQ